MPRESLEPLSNPPATSVAPPIPMLLTCPACGARHIDAGDFVTKVHHTHACQRCGMVWRPAIVPTVGVRFLPGFKDAPPRSLADGTVRARVLAAFPDDDALVEAGDLVELMPEVNVDVIRTTLSKLTADGTLRRMRHGIYKLADQRSASPKGTT